MSQAIAANIEILGKSYQIRCPESELPSLQRAAQFLEERMKYLRDHANVLSLDRLAIITALNMANQLLTIEHEKAEQIHAINQRLHELQAKIERVVTPPPHVQLEFA